MSYTISLHQDKNLTSTIKYRNGFNVPSIYTTTVVNNGNFSNKNLFVDNSIELGCGQINPPMSAYQKVTDATHIKIEWDKYTVIGHITDLQYINDNNILISYIVDTFSSALECGMIDDIKGLCERTHLKTNTQFTNQQSEPFSPSNILQLNKTLTENMNMVAEGFDGITPSNAGLYEKTSYILTVSPSIVEYLGNVTPFSTPNVSEITLKSRSSLNFERSDSTIHSGGVYRGTPLKFEQMADVTKFIRDILSGCGFRTTMGANGWKTQQAISHRQYITDANTGAGQARNEERNVESEPMESIFFITLSDIYNLYCIPSNFAINRTTFFEVNYSLTGFKTVGNLHRFGAEDTTKNKLLNFPFCSYRVVTANGDTQDIFPHQHYWTFSDIQDVRVNYRYIGGDSPRLMAMINPSETETTYGRDGTGEWFTVRNYPAITLSINNAFNPQIQKEVANIRKISASYSKANANGRLSNPFKQGYLDGVQGNNLREDITTGRGAWGRFAGGLGKGLGVADKFLSEPFFSSPDTPNAGLFKNQNYQDMMNAVSETNAGNFVEAVSSQIMGNDFTSQFSIPAFTVYNTGATDTELFAYCRYFDEFGQSCNCILNPLTNHGDLFGGNASVTSYNGKTFYKYSNIVITGIMPISWKISIKELFESGVYLI